MTSSRSFVLRLPSCSTARMTTARRSASIGGVFTNALNDSGVRSGAKRTSRLKSRFDPTYSANKAHIASSFITSSSPWIKYTHCSAFFGAGGGGGGGGGGGVGGE